MKGTKIKMREVEKKDYTFSNDEYDSIFVGICKSQELLNEYFDKDYELLSLGYIGSEFGVDFNINTYEYSCAVKPHIRAGGNRQSGIRKPLLRVYSRNALSKPYTSRIDLSF